MNAYVTWLAEELARKFPGECRVLTMQYDAAKMPENDAEARERLNQFKNNAHNRHRRRGLIFRVATATSTGDGGDSYTHVAVVTMGIDNEELRELWPYGPMEIRRKRMDAAGIVAMANYLGTLRGKTEQRCASQSETEECPHNEAIRCDGLDDCGHCGWNPQVAERRKREARLRCRGTNKEKD